MIGVAGYESPDVFLQATVPDVTLEGFIEASLAQDGVLAADVPEAPDAPTERLRDLWKELLNRASTSIDQRLQIRADWNPSLHPRGPDGRFVSRPFDVPDDILGMDTGDIVRELADSDPDFAEKVGDLAIDGVLDVDESLDEALEGVDRQNISQMQMARSVDGLEQHAREIRETADGEFPLIELDEDTLVQPLEFDDGSTLTPDTAGRNAAWEMTVAPDEDAEQRVDALRDRGYLVREYPDSDESSDMREFLVGVTGETEAPEAPDTPDAGDGVLAQVPDDTVELAMDRIGDYQDTYDRFGGDGDFHIADPSQYDWDSMESADEFSDAMLDITPAVGFTDSTAEQHKDRLKERLREVKDPKTQVQAASRLETIERTTDGGSVSWQTTRDTLGGTTNVMELESSSSDQTVDHEFMHSFIDGAGVAHQVDSSRAKQYNRGDRNVQWDEDTLLADSNGIQEYMLTDSFNPNSPPGLEDWRDEVEAEFLDAEDRIPESAFTPPEGIDDIDGDGWGETLGEGDVIKFLNGATTEKVAVKEVNQDAFDGEEGHQVIAMHDGYEQKLKMDDEGNIHLSSPAPITAIAQGELDEGDFDPPGSTPAEELAKEAPGDPEERLEEFHSAVNKAFYRQAWASTEDTRTMDKMIIESRYSATNAHETAAMVHGTIHGSSGQRVSTIRRMAEHHPMLLRTYIQNFDVDEGVAESIREVAESDQTFGDGDVAPGLEALLEQVEA